VGCAARRVEPRRGEHVGRGAVCEPPMRYLIVGVDGGDEDHVVVSQVKTVSKVR
jgi:hypothetical protein